MVPHDMLSHLANHPEHKDSHITVNQEQYLQAITACNIAPELPSPPMLPCSPLAGLAIYPALSCGHCNWAATNIDSFRQHYIQCHPQIKRPLEYNSCHVQRFNRVGTGRRWIRVHISTTVASNTRTIEEAALKALEDRLNTPIYNPTMSEDPRIVSPWLLSTKWHLEIRGLDASILYQSARSGKEFKGLSNAALTWLQSATTRQHMLDKITRQTLLTDDPMKCVHQCF